MANPTPAPSANPFAQSPLHTGPITALQLIDRIIAKTGAPDRASTVDRVTAGDPTLSVTGIATTAMATLECLKRAAAANRNLIVTYDPAFWSTSDSLDRMEGDGLFQLKRDFIRDNRLVCFNLHDHWRDMTPDGIATGMARALKWEGFITDPARPDIFQLPPTTLLGLATELGARLQDRTLRVVGDPKLPVRQVAAIWGNAAQLPSIHLVNGQADVLICGYGREWEVVEYVQDMVAAGGKKGLILLGEAKSVEGGMKYCADWLKTFITEVPVDYLPMDEPFWNPDEAGN
jgi:putative NIF3 family GTP cyclohydrolase 1 type 2